MTDRQSVPSAKNDSADRRSACPGLFRLAPALDGAICRVKLAGGHLSAAQAEAVALAANLFSTAPIELTNRANFQIRAIQPADEMPLIEALMMAGLGPQPVLGPQPGEGGNMARAIEDPALLGSDDVRNVMVSPMAGRDPQQIVDILPLAGWLLKTLQSKRRYHALSPKFSIQLDGGESVAMLDHPHDIWLSVISADEAMIGLAGCMPVLGTDATPPGDCALMAVPLVAAHDAICAMLDLFLEIGNVTGATRMKQLPPELAGAGFIDRLQPRLPVSVRRDETVAAWRRRPVGSAVGAHLGLVAERVPGFLSVGAMPPLGRVTPDQLLAVAALAQQFGDGSLRLTPWQSLMVPSLTKVGAAVVLKRLEMLGLFSDAMSPFARMIACTGSAGCGSGLAATQADGVKLAGLMQSGKSGFPVHLSGCEKSCAAARAMPTTLVAVAPGRYDLYRSDSQSRQAMAKSRFGHRLAGNITVDEAASLLVGLASEESEKQI